MIIYTFNYEMDCSPHIWNKKPQIRLVQTIPIYVWNVANQDVFEKSYKNWNERNFLFLFK